MMPRPPTCASQKTLLPTSRASCTRLRSGEEGGGAGREGRRERVNRERVGKAKTEAETETETENETGTGTEGGTGTGRQIETDREMCRMI